MDEHRQQAVHECLLLTQEGVGVTHGTAQDAADDVTSLGIAGQLAVGNAEGDGAQVVGQYAHGHISLLLLAIAVAAHVADGLDDGLEHIGVIVGVLALDDAHQSLKAHASIDDVHREGFQMSVGLALILHEHDVPYLDDLWVVLVHQVAAGYVTTLLGQTVVDVNLGAGATWTRITHLPEVVVLVAVDDMVGRHVLEPVLGCLVVALETFLLTSLEDGHIEILGVELEHAHQILPRHVDGSFLEVVAERPVAKHLKHGMVVGIMAHLLQVVMLSAHAQTLLAVGTSAGFGIACTQYDILPLVHASVGEHQCRVVLNHHRG